MIKTEIVMINGKAYIYTYSGSGYLIKKDVADNETDVSEEEL